MATREITVEEYLHEHVTELGGFCLKLPSRWYVGIPDRLVLMPKARIAFVELKRPVGGRLGTKQPWWRRALEKLGFKVVYLKTCHECEDFLLDMLD